MGQDRWITIQEVADIINVSFGTVQAILTSHWNIHRVTAYFMPMFLGLDQKQYHVEICEAQNNNNDDDDDDDDDDETK